MQTRHANNAAFGKAPAPSHPGTKYRLVTKLGGKPNISGLVVGGKSKHQAGNHFSGLSGLLYKI